MSAFFEYVRNITYYLLFAALAGMLAPGGKYKKYVSLATGLVLICLLIQPLRALFDGFPVTEVFAGLVTAPADTNADGMSQTMDYAAMRYETIKAAFDEQLRAQLTDLLARNGYALETAELAYTEDLSRIEHVAVSVTANEAQIQRKPFIYVEPVRVTVGSANGVDEMDGEDDPAAAAVKKIIADFYELPEAHIDVRVHT